MALLTLGVLVGLGNQRLELSVFAEDLQVRVLLHVTEVIPASIDGLLQGGQGIGGPIEG